MPYHAPYAVVAVICAVAIITIIAFVLAELKRDVNSLRAEHNDLAAYLVPEHQQHDERITDVAVELDRHIDDLLAHTTACYAHHTEDCQLCHTSPTDELNPRHNESRADRHPLHRRATNCHVHHSAYANEPCTTLCIFDDDLPF